MFHDSQLEHFNCLGGCETLLDKSQYKRLRSRMSKLTEQWKQVKKIKIEAKAKRYRAQCKSEPPHQLAIKTEENEIKYTDVHC